MKAKTLSTNPEVILKNALLQSSPAYDAVLRWPTFDEAKQAVQDEAGLTFIFMKGVVFSDVSTDKNGLYEARAFVETEEVTLVEIQHVVSLGGREDEYLLEGVVYDEIINEDETISCTRQTYKIYIESPYGHYHTMGSYDSGP